MEKRKMIDVHLHIEAWENEEATLLDCFEKYKKEYGVSAVNINCIATFVSTTCNNIMAAFYKMCNKNVYVHGGIDYYKVPVVEVYGDGLDFVTQHNELMEMGFDGIKMLEGKPNVHKHIGKNLNNEPFDQLFSAIEKNNTHLIFHVNDPKEFWEDGEGAQGLKDLGWFYGDGTFASHEEIYRQTEKVLEMHPNLKVTFAHFYFCGETPEKLEYLFSKYPNMGVDLTPGTEMYHSFEKNHDYYVKFFTKYADRIMIGTDGTFPWPASAHGWCFDRVSRFIYTNDKMMAFNDSILTGLGLPEEAAEKILHENFERKVSKEPKPINKEALKKYIDKHWNLLKDDEKANIDRYAKLCL